MSAEDKRKKKWKATEEIKEHKKKKFQIKNSEGRERERERDGGGGGERKTRIVKKNCCSR